MSVSAVPVAVTGLSWNSVLLAGINVLLGGVCVALVKAWPSIRKLNNEREANLLEERAVEMTSMRKRIAVLEAERAVDRHRINNLTQCLDALLMMIEQDPAKAAQAAARIQAMRAKQMETEALEKGAVMSANIADGGAA